MPKRRRDQRQRDIGLTTLRRCSHQLAGDKLLVETTRARSWLHRRCFAGDVPNTKYFGHTIGVRSLQVERSTSTSGSKSCRRDPAPIGTLTNIFYGYLLPPVLCEHQEANPYTLLRIPRHDSESPILIRRLRATGVSSRIGSLLAQLLIYICLDVMRQLVMAV